MNKQGKVVVAVVGTGVVVGGLIALAKKAEAAGGGGGGGTVITYAADINFTLPKTDFVSGQTYHASVTVTNKSTDQNGQAAAAQLSAVIIGHFLPTAGSLQDVITIQTDPVSHSFAGGESFDFDIPFDIPADAVGVGGSGITAAVTDPNGNALGSQTISVTTAPPVPQVTIGIINIPEPPAGGTWADWTLEVLYNERVVVKATNYSGTGIVSPFAKSAALDAALTIPYPGQLTPEQIAGYQSIGEVVTVLNVYYRIILGGYVTNGGYIDIWWSTVPSDVAGTTTTTNEYVGKVTTTIIKVSPALPTSGDLNWDCTANKFVPV